MSLEDWFNQRWYPKESGPSATALFSPLAGLYGQVTARRRQRFLKSPPQPFPVPVIVVGNITAGGAGKTPLVAELARWLHERGFSPGIVSRGYGGRAKQYPYQVTAQSHPLECGDEPLMLHLITDAPVMVSPDRAEAARALVDYHNCDVILADDGLQHYRLWRSFEICVVDGQRGLGNGKLLPSGPLREPKGRLQEVDLVVCNGSAEPEVAAELEPLQPMQMQLEAASWHQFNLDETSTAGLESGPPVGPCHAVAAIGNPQRFFRQLDTMGFHVREHGFGDHHQFNRFELDFDEDVPVIMTMKDAVKCRDFWQPKWWALEVRARLPDLFYQKIHHHLQEFQKHD